MSDQHHISTVKKAHFLNDQERNCFDILTHSVEHSMIILPKVQVEDLFEQPSNQSDEAFWTKFKRVSEKHLDFLICNRNDFKPLLCIRIRGENHHEQINEDDDEFLRSILKHAGIPMLDISFAEIDQYRRAFEEEAMHVRIKDALHLD